MDKFLVLSQPEDNEQQLLTPLEAEDENDATLQAMAAFAEQGIVAEVIGVEIIPENTAEAIGKALDGLGQKFEAYKSAQ